MVEQIDSDTTAQDSQESQQEFPSDDDSLPPPLLNPELSIQEACEEYKQSVRVTLRLINNKLNEALSVNLQALEELHEKIAARTRFLENNPTFLACLPDITDIIKNETIIEFSEIKSHLKRDSQKILDRLQETEKMHDKLFNLVTKKSVEIEEFEIPEKETPTLSQSRIQPSKPVENSTYNSFNFQYFPDLQPDVWRGRPFEDLHFRLVQQLEATDSLEGFIKHMNRKPSENNNRKRRNKAQKLQDLQEKYTGSLWFFHKNINQKLSRASITSKSSRASQISQGRKTKISQSTNNTKKSSVCSCNLLKTSSQSPYMSNEEKSRRIRQQLQNQYLRCYDLLDDIEKKDLKPIESEYPRRDNLFSSDDLQKFKNIQNYKSYLHKIVDENENETTWKKLLESPPPAQKPRRVLKKRENPQRYMGEDVKSLMQYLVQPSKEKIKLIQPQNIIVMPVRVIYDRFPTKDTKETTTNNNNNKIPPLQLNNNNNNNRNTFVTDLTKSPRYETPQSTPKSPKITFLTPKSTPNSGRAQVLYNKAENVPKFVNSVPQAQSPIVRKKMMLEHLRGLKARNDTIQKNIQSAIDVIETKMLDILSSPQDSNSTEAFNAMEKEITKVLKMMNDGDKKQAGAVDGKVEKIEAEKDENCQKNTECQHKMKRGTTIVRKNNNNNNNTLNSSPVIDFVPGVDLAKNNNVNATPRVTFTSPETKNINSKNAKTAEDTKKDTKILKPENENQDNNKQRKVLVQERNGKLLTIEKKKAANIEEGERLLGQVDNVIKKIDSIYTKFYTEKTNRSKSPAGKIDKQKENTYNNVIEFFDGLKQIIDTPPVEIFYKKTENIAQKFQQAKTYDQATVYYNVVTIDGCDKKSEAQGQGDVMTTEQSSVDDNKMLICEEQLRIIEDRHGFILKAFYSVFFSGVFVALNFDFTC